MKTRSTFAMMLTVAMLTVAAVPEAAYADDAGAAYLDIEETYGMMPGFFRLFPSDEIAEAWSAFTALQMNPELAIDPKTRELIGIAVAAREACKPCVYFHIAAAVANGASQIEVAEALTITNATDRLDSALVIAGVDMDAFKREADLVLWGDAQADHLKAPNQNLLRLVETIGRAVR